MVVRSTPVSTFLAVTWTRGTTAPVGSAMRPSRVPVTVCAVAADQSRLRAAIERIDFTLTSRNRRIIHAVDRNGRQTARIAHWGRMGGSQHRGNPRPTGLTPGPN